MGTRATGIAGHLRRQVGSGQGNRERHGQGHAGDRDECGCHPSYAAGRAAVPAVEEVVERRRRPVLDRLVEHRDHRLLGHLLHSGGRTLARQRHRGSSCLSLEQRLHQLGDPAGGRGAELVVHDGAVALELVQRTAGVAAAQVGADRHLVRQLAQRLDLAGRAGGVDGQRHVALLQAVQRHPLEGLGAQLLEAARARRRPSRRTTRAAARHRAARSISSRATASVIGSSGEPGGAPQVVHVDLDARVERDRRPPRLQQAGTPLLAVEHRPAQAGQGALVGAVGPQRAGDLRAGTAVGEARRATSRCSRCPSSTSAPSTRSCQPPSSRRRAGATATALCSVMTATSPEEKPSCDWHRRPRHLAHSMLLGGTSRNDERRHPHISRLGLDRGCRDSPVTSLSRGSHGGARRLRPPDTAPRGEVNTMRNALSIAELETEHTELLPTRETLSWFGNSNWANVFASNTSMALNAASFGSLANSAAYQAITVTQG